MVTNLHYFTLLSLIHMYVKQTHKGRYKNKIEWSRHLIRIRVCSGFDRDHDTSGVSSLAGDSSSGFDTELDPNENVSMEG